MSAGALEEAVALLIAARRTGVLIDAFPASCRPATIAAAHEIQDATVGALQDTVAGWKIASAPDGSLMRGVLLQSRVYSSPVRIDPAQVPLLGVEAEIAFQFEQPMPPRDRDYTYAEVAERVIALPAIEVVDSRFRSYQGTPLLHRLADCMSNGAFIRGAPQPRWRDHDLTRLRVSLVIDGTVVVDGVGGHPTRDPLLPAVALVNHLRVSSGVQAGQVMTTGTYTGLNFARPGQAVTAIFDGFGSTEVSF